MTTDDQITSDLAIVGRASREGPLPLAATLRAVRAPESSDATEPGRADLSLLAMARVYGTRVARIAVSIQLLVFVALALVVLTTQEDAGTTGLLTALSHTSPVEGAIWTLACATLVHVIVWQLAVARFERSLAGASEPLVLGARAVRRVDRWSTALVIAATMAFVLTAGICFIVAGPYHLLDLRRLDAPPWIASLRTWTLWSLYLAVGASVAGAIVIARSAQRTWSPRGWLAGLAATTLAITIYVGLREDVGPMLATLKSGSYSTEMLPDLTLRTALMVSGTVSLFTLVASYVLARRRREDAAIRG